MFVHNHCINLIKLSMKRVTTYPTRGGKFFYNIRYVADYP
jgi:ribulose-5-phosphate 4-epimerase/fuculose-1-phosphate aldolase